MIHTLFRFIVGFFAIAVLAVGSIFFFGGSGTTVSPWGALPAGVEVVSVGTYTVVPEESVFSWSAQKPFIEGYINSGTIGIGEGLIEVTDTPSARGTFSMDMNTLAVGLTAKKPGAEGALLAHLKGESFFDVAQYPTAVFSIDSVTPLDEARFLYTIVGSLTLKGKTETLSFPATIYLKDGTLYAQAATEFDRTRWGITFGSVNFFAQIGDNAISDMVAISFSLVARSGEPQKLMSLTGNLVKYESKDFWSLLYEEPGQPALNKELIFTRQSGCSPERVLVRCSSYSFAPGDRVTVEGSEADSTFTVHTLIRL